MSITPLVFFVVFITIFLARLLLAFCICLFCMMLEDVLEKKEGKCGEMIFGPIN